MTRQVLVSKGCTPCQDRAASVYACAKKGECVIQAMVLESEVQPQKCTECTERNDEPREKRILPCKHRGNFIGDKRDVRVECFSPAFVHEAILPSVSCVGCPFTDVDGGPPVVTAPAQKKEPIKVSRVVPPTKAIVFNRHNEPADFLGNSFSGACMLVCGGPSVGKMDLSPLSQRGVVVAAVSQVAATHVRPQLWFSCDQATTYSEALWKDGGIMKFAARQWRNAGEDSVYAVRRDGGWVKAGQPVRQLGNVWYYERCDRWDLKGFLSMPAVTWRTTEGSKIEEGREPVGRKSVMLVALRLLYWLGFREVYLIGCDFEMRPDYQYAFVSHKGSGASRSNNKTFEKLNHTFERLGPVFEEHGYRVYNATPGGKLEAFKRVTYEQAVLRCRQSFPEKIDVDGLYH